MSENPSTDRGPKPDAVIEPGEPNPGGVDARSDSDGVDNGTIETEPLPRDLDPDQNPAVDTALPEEMKETEDTGTKATRTEGGESEGAETDKESPA